MNAKSRARISEIKSRVSSMLRERQSLQGGGDTANPSKYWTDFCSFFDYMPSLSEESFEKLRLHTYHLTADNYQTYYFNVDLDIFAQYWRGLHAGVPPRYVLSEPEGGIGFSIDGRLVSHDILRFQSIVNTFLRRGVISSMQAAGAARGFALEIGAGYGGLAHHLSNVIGGVTYFIVDLPETLIFSAPYLFLQNPAKKVYVYGDSDFGGFIESGEFASYDFVLIPNYKLSALRNIRFDLAVNVASLQEMSAHQAAEYLDFLADGCAGLFYSLNQDVQPRNSELGNLSDMIRARFEVTEASLGLLPTSRMGQEGAKQALRRAMRKAATSLGILDAPRESFKYPPFKEWLCRSRKNKNKY
ncbi:MAG: putative sugar O-methyltransferase [Deltaproteobacteria bacterium]